MISLPPLSLMVREKATTPGSSSFSSRVFRLFDYMGTFIMLLIRLEEGGGGNGLSLSWLLLLLPLQTFVRVRQFRCLSFFHGKERGGDGN